MDSHECSSHTCRRECDESWLRLNRRCHPASLADEYSPTCPSPTPSHHITTPLTICSYYPCTNSSTSCSSRVTIITQSNRNISTFLLWRNYSTWSMPKKMFLVLLEISGFTVTYNLTDLFFKLTSSVLLVSLLNLLKILKLQTDCTCQLQLPATNTAYLVGFWGHRKLNTTCEKFAAVSCGIRKLARGIWYKDRAEYLDSLIGASIQIVLWCRQSTNPVVQTGNGTFQLHWRHVPHLIQTWYKLHRTDGISFVVCLILNLYEMPGLDPTEFDISLIT